MVREEWFGKLRFFSSSRKVVDHKKISEFEHFYGTTFLHFSRKMVAVKWVNEVTNQRYLKNWTDVGGKICLGRT